MTLVELSAGGAAAVLAVCSIVGFIEKFGKSLADLKGAYFGSSTSSDAGRVRH